MHPLDAVFGAVGKDGPVPAAVAGVVRPEATSYLEAFGLADPAAGRPLRTDAVFRIASMTKAVTSVAAMQCIERGQLELDGPLDQLLPDLAALQVATVDRAGAATFRPPASAITLRQLLSHSSGLGYHIWNPDLARYAAAQAEGFDLFFALPLIHEPGTRWEYSTSTDWVGRAVEEASGLDLEQYFRSQIFAPLAMVDSSFIRSPELEARLVRLHDRQPEGGWTPSAAELPPPNRYYSGGGGLLSTAPDYLRFVQALLRGGESDGARILREESVAQMGENQIGDLVVREMPESLPFSNRFLIGPPGEGKFGLGFHINTQALTGRRSAGSLAWAGLFNSYYWIDPAAEIAGVLCMQMLPFFDDACIDLLDAFETAVYATLG